jgi:lysozyme
MMPDIRGFLRGLFRPRVAGSVGGGAIAAAVAFISPWEGMVPVAYLDRIAQPPVWTVCYGETLGVQQGDSYTPDECASMLIERLPEYRDGLTACLPALPDQPEGVQVALISWTYNVGVGAACRSTLARRGNSGDWIGACNELPRWNRAGGVEVQGLTNRRAAEQTLCHEALR